MPLFREKMRTAIVNGFGRGQNTAGYDDDRRSGRFDQNQSADSRKKRQGKGNGRGAIALVLAEDFAAEVVRPG